MKNFVRFVRALRTALLGAPHRHSWETIRASYLTNEQNINIGQRYVLRCKGCGEIKGRDIA